MDEHTATGSPSPLTSVPWPVWLLLAGAVVQLGVRIAPDSYQLFGPYLLVSFDMAIEWIRSISLFLLAAAVVLSADRWPAGRRRLLIGAAAIGVVALLRMVRDIWWAIWETSPGLIADGTQLWLNLEFLAAGVGFVASHALLAAGLWAVRTHRPISGVGAVIMVVVGLGGIVTTAGGLWAAALTFENAPADHLLYAVAVSMLTAAGFAALAALALAALRVAPRRGGLPEILIAVGAMVTMVGSAWAWTFPYFTPEPQIIPEESFVWVFTLPNVAVAAGMVTMIAGFGLGAVAAYRGRVEGDRTA